MECPLLVQLGASPRASPVLFAYVYVLTIAAYLGHCAFLHQFCDAYMSVYIWSVEMVTTFPQL